MGKQIPIWMSYQNPMGKIAMIYFLFVFLYLVMVGFTFQEFPIVKQQKINEEHFDLFFGLSLVWPITLPLLMLDYRKFKNYSNKKEYLKLKKKYDELTKEAEFLRDLKENHYDFLKGMG